MNTNRGSTSGRNSMSARFRCRIQPALLTLLAPLTLALIVPARAGTQPPAIPFSDIGARATANYQGDALGITATADGARLRCGFQKLEGHATPEGLWLESTKPGGGRLRLVAVAVGRDGNRARQCALTEAASSVRSGMSIVTVPHGDQAPLGATWTHGAASFFDMPLLTELETPLADAPFYRHATPNGASVCLRQGVQTLAPTGKVSAEDKLVRFTRPGLTEEYSVSVDGVRQDFIIQSPPLNSQPSTLNPPAGDLRLELALSGARAEATASGARLKLDGSGRALAYSRLRVEDATGRELTARLEVLCADRLAVTVADANATYPVRIDPTFSDARWVSLNPGMPGANNEVFAIVVDGKGNMYVCGTFTFIGTVPANGIAKWDGSAWSALGAGMSSGNLPCVFALAISGTNLYAGGYFTTAGGVPVGNIAKWDGSAWSALGSGIDGLVEALAVSGPNLYAGGNFTTAGGVRANCIAKWNGSAWSALGSGVNGEVLALAVSGTNLYAGGNFTTAGGVPANYIAKWDGSVWSALGSGMNGWVYALTVIGTNLYAGGDFTTASGAPANGIAKWNGSAWSALGSGMNNGVQALAVSGTNLYVGGYSTTGGVTVNNIAKWNGSTWSALGSGVNGEVLALAVSGTNLYAGGNFTTAGGVTANDIAKWDSSAWSALGSGMNQPVLALTVSGTDLYVAGDFTAAGGVPANYIAKWDGSAWSALGSGMNQPVLALTVSGTNLYAGGWFTTAGGVPANYIAKWDGRAWSALGSGMGGSYPYVDALVVSSTNLYAGGYFTTAGGVPANYIAKWNGSAWSALGSAVNGDVFALAVSGPNLYVGGYFTTAGGVTVNNIAKWNGSTWSALGSGIGGINPATVYALAVGGTRLYAGGYFTTAGGVSAANIAKWDGSTWSALGSGLNNQVKALAVSGTDLYAGGEFTTAGGVPADYIAKWDGSAWSALGSGVDGNVSALAADASGHLFVGGTFCSAGTNVSPYIAQANGGSSSTNAPPAIFASPASLAVPIGATADLGVDADGSPPLAYQWVFNGTTAIAGATGSVLSLTNVQLTQAGVYSVTVTNLYGAVTSAPAVLTVTGVPPAIVASPVSLRVASGVTVDFQVGAAGSPPLVYQWLFNGTNAIADATGSVLSLTNVQLTQAGAYSAIVSNLYGTVTSAPALLQVFTRGIVVTNTETALRDAMSLGGTVTFACDGTITLSSTITIGADTTLDGSGHNVTISGHGAVRVFVVFANVNFTVAHLTICGGASDGGSAILNLSGTVNLTNDSFSGNNGVHYGPVVTPGQSPGAGGAIYNSGGRVNALNCSFGDNQAFGAAPWPPQIGSLGLGGAIYNGGNLTLDLCTFTGNSAWGKASGGAGTGASGGAIFNDYGAILTADRTTFCGNSASGGSGADGTSEAYPPSNDGSSGGDANGGAICNQGSCVLARSTFCQNRASGGAGGNGGSGWSHHIALDGGAGGNGGSGLGAAVAGAASLVNCTIAFNVGSGGAGGYGGAGGGGDISNGSGGAGGNGGGGSGGVDATCNLTNCTFAWNAGIGGPGGAGGPAGSDAGTPGAGGANGISGGGAPGTGGNSSINILIVSNSPAGGDTFPDPKLGPLADNGGPTLTMALLPGSPAIDAGNTSLAPPTDQRGFPRPAGLAADIGAFEYGSVIHGPPQVSTLPATGVSPTSATLNGTVNPVGWPATAWFQWGATTNYGNLTSVTVLGSGTTALPLFAPLAGLTPKVTYHFRVAATNNYGLAYGSDQSFTTLVLPQVSTWPARPISTNSATLNGTVNPNGWPATAWFQWGATTNYGNVTPVTALGGGTTDLPLSASLAGLTLNVTYHFRVLATNDYGLVCGSDQSFTTGSGAVLPFDANWVSLGSGMGSVVCALAVSGTNLYAGGGFTTAGGVPANHIAKWDGRAWSALGSGLNGGVLALAVSGTNLYVGGDFTTAGGVPAYYIAKWDGRAWSGLGSGMNQPVCALAVSGPNLYAGGYFTTAGEVWANCIAKWDGSAWSALGSGMSEVSALAVSGTNLYAGGYFTDAGGAFANYIAKWDGSAWSALGSGTGWIIYALAISGTDLYAAGGNIYGNVAKWNGSAWSSLLYLGYGYTVYALDVDGTNLYAGGNFQIAAGGVTARNIAKWDGSAWSALGSGMNNQVYALAADGVGHLFVGGVFSLAGNNESPYVAEAILAPTAPTISTLMPTQTAEAGATVHLAVNATGDPPPIYQWYFNGTNLLSCTSSNLVLTNILFSQSGTYTVVAINDSGAVTSAPVTLNVIPAVERRPVPGIKVTGQTGSLLNLDYADFLRPAPNWTTLGSVSLTSTSQNWFDLTLPLPPQRFYRAWRTGAPGVFPSLELHMVPAITLTGSIGGSVRVDAINRFGPTDAWFTLDTVTLTNTSQLYFDTSAWRQPPRLYRLVPSP